jgi:hypothetical protein
MTPSIWKLGQWRQSLEDCPANAYLIEERKPLFNDLSGERAEKRRLQTEIAKFKMTTGNELPTNSTRPQFEEAKRIWETAQEIVREEKRKRELTMIRPLIKIWPAWLGPKGSYMQDSNGNIVPNPNFRKGTTERERRERGRGRTRGHGGRDRGDDSRSRSRRSSDHHHLDWRNFE